MRSARCFLQRRLWVSTPRREGIISVTHRPKRAENGPAIRAQAVGDRDIGPCALYSPAALLVHCGAVQCLC
jgi:hypothetical protein